MGNLEKKYFVRGQSMPLSNFPRNVHDPSNLIFNKYVFHCFLLDFDRHSHRQLR